MNVKTNCPNCGAPIDKWKCKCDYCGTFYLDLSAMDIDSHKPFFLRIRHDGTVTTVPVRLVSMVTHLDANPVALYSDDRIVEQLYDPELTIDLELRQVRIP